MIANSQVPRTLHAEAALRSEQLYMNVPNQTSSLMAYGLYGGSIIIKWIYTKKMLIEVGRPETAEAST